MVTGFERVPSVVDVSSRGDTVLCFTPRDGLRRPGDSRVVEFRRSRTDRHGVERGHARVEHDDDYRRSDTTVYRPEDLRLEECEEESTVGIFRIDFGRWIRGRGYDEMAESECGLGGCGGDQGIFGNYFPRESGLGGEDESVGGRRAQGRGNGHAGYEGIVGRLIEMNSLAGYAEKPEGEE